MTAPASNSKRRPARAVAMVLLGGTYPLLAHFAALSADPVLIATSVALLVTLTLAPSLNSGSRLAWGLLLVGTVVISIVATSRHALVLLFFPPILITGFMAWIFSRTLRRGQAPLIERIVRIMHGPDAAIADEIVAYARRVTEVWAFFLVLLTAVNLSLALLAKPGGLLLAMGFEPRVSVPLATWSLFANVLNYGFLGALFIGEYLVRGRRFPQQPYRGPIDFARKLSGLGDVFRSRSNDRTRPDQAGIGR